jgi:hypothetical protein
MEIIDIILPVGDDGNFFCPLSGAPAISEDGELGESCIAYIPPAAFADAYMSCARLAEFWEETLRDVDRDALEGNVTGELIKDILEHYEEPQNQKLIGFRVMTTTLHPIYAPEFLDPIHTIAVFYVVNFWCRVAKS